MGNSQGKESRDRGSRRGSSSPVIRQESRNSTSDNPPQPTPSIRNRRASRPDFSFLGIGASNDADTSSLEARRENKQEREARKAEKERVARLKERERSMKEEHVDGGYLVTQGVYVGIEDYHKSIVRQLMIERRLAPFWKGLNDFSESWAEHQLMAAARGWPIPPADQVPPELEYQPTKKLPPLESHDATFKNQTIPINGRSLSFQSDKSQNLSPTGTSLPISSLTSANQATSPNLSLFRSRAKTLASLTTTSRSNQADMTPREFQLPSDPSVNGQPIEVYLYKDATECPICFLYYPPYLNTTRCCEQPICSECFVQIKRPDPHAPEHEQPDANAPSLSEAEREAQAEGLLVSEVATCPYCKQPEFGITYVPPTFRRGLTYGTGSQPYQLMSATSSQTSINSNGLSPGPARRRGTSLSASAPEVITTDKIRPDWASKLSAARAHAARRSAAATALHTAAYLMNGQSDVRPFGGFARRNMLRRPTLESNEGGPNVHLNALAMLAERQAARQQEVSDTPSQANAFLPPPRVSSSRRNRMDDLEDIMMMEAIRLSIASEEERRRKEEKDAKKKAKKEEKDKKKEDRTGRKGGLFATTSNTSNGDLTYTGSSESRSNLTLQLEEEAAAGKGKDVARVDSPASDTDGSRVEEQVLRPSYVPELSFPGTSQESLASSIPMPSAAEPFRRSHLRQMSNASSASSSFVEANANGIYPGNSTPPPGSLEPMFNFRSLAAMIGEEDKAEGSSHIEDAAEQRRTESRRSDSSESSPQRSPNTIDSDLTGKGRNSQPLESVPHSQAAKQNAILPVADDETKTTTT